jgi:hypothetical protein
MVKYMEEKVHADDFCKEFCTGLAQENLSKCVVSCVKRTENTLQSFEPEETRVIISEQYTTPATSAHQLKTPAADAIGSIRYTVALMNYPLPPDFPKLVTNIIPNVRFGSLKTDAKGLATVLYGW